MVPTMQCPLRLKGFPFHTIFGLPNYFEKASIYKEKQPLFTKNRFSPKGYITSVGIFGPLV
eukprot:c35856_g1_i1 orf=48-230(+)